jgi:hypothetical protein
MTLSVGSGIVTLADGSRFDLTKSAIVSDGDHEYPLLHVIRKDGSVQGNWTNMEDGRTLFSERNWKMGAAATWRRPRDRLVTTRWLAITNASKFLVSALADELDVLFHTHCGILSGVRRRDRYWQHNLTEPDRFYALVCFPSGHGQLHPNRQFQLEQCPYRQL